MMRSTTFGARQKDRSPLRAVGLLGLLFGTLVPGAVAADARRYRVDPEASRIDVKVGTAGLFKFAGHDHGVRVKVRRGEIVAAATDLSASSVTLVFSMADVRVVSSEGPAADIPKVQEKMAGPAVLDTGRFPEATFRSLRVTGRKLGPIRFELDLVGELTLHGVTRPLSARISVEVKSDRLVARGQATLKQSDFGIDPVSVAGVVKVKNELALDLEIAAAAVPAE
jgi:polyisoprenoid-binding protein YceI